MFSLFVARTDNNETTEQDRKPFENIHMLESREDQYLSCSQLLLESLERIFSF